MTEPRQWTLTMRAPAEWLNSNDRTNRRYDTRPRDWRRAARDHAKVARQRGELPRGPLRHITVAATLTFPVAARRDSHNYMPTLKAVMDGLVDYGLIPDDNDEHLTGPTIQIGPPDRTSYGYGWLTLDIKETP